MNWKREQPSFFLLMAFSLFGCLLLFLRILYSERLQHTFFLWNLFLAWIPYVCSLLALHLADRKRPVLFGSVLFVWLAFYPNAAYLLTDLLHMKLNPYAPIWFELFLMSTFAIIGLLIGYVSLEHIREIVIRRYSVRISWMFAAFILFLTSFGIYLGRFLRWNSWNVLTHPIDLLKDIGARFFIPFEHPQTWGFTLIVFGFLSLFHAVLLSFGQRTRLDGTKNP